MMEFERIMTLFICSIICITFCETRGQNPITLFFKIKPYYAEPKLPEGAFYQVEIFQRANRVATAFTKCPEQIARLQFEKTIDRSNMIARFTAVYRNNQGLLKAIKQENNNKNLKWPFIQNFSLNMDKPVITLDLNKNWNVTNEKLDMTTFPKECANFELKWENIEESVEYLLYCKKSGYILKDSRANKKENLIKIYGINITKDCPENLYLMKFRNIKQSKFTEIEIKCPTTEIEDFNIHYEIIYDWLTLKVQCKVLEMADNGHRLPYWESRVLLPPLPTEVSLDEIEIKVAGKKTKYEKKMVKKESEKERKEEDQNKSIKTDKGKGKIMESEQRSRINTTIADRYLELKTESPATGETTKNLRKNKKLLRKEGEGKTTAEREISEPIILEDSVESDENQNKRLKKKVRLVLDHSDEFDESPNKKNKKRGRDGEIAESKRRRLIQNDSNESETNSGIQMQKWWENLLQMETNLARKSTENADGQEIQSPIRGENKLEKEKEVIKTGQKIVEEGYDNIRNMESGSGQQVGVVNQGDEQRKRVQEIDEKENERTELEQTMLVGKENELIKKNGEDVPSESSFVTEKMMDKRKYIDKRLDEDSSLTKGRGGSSGQLKQKQINIQEKTKADGERPPMLNNELIQQTSLLGAEGGEEMEKLKGKESGESEIVPLKGHLSRQSHTDIIPNTQLGSSTFRLDSTIQFSQHDMQQNEPQHHWHGKIEKKRQRKKQLKANRPTMVGNSLESSMPLFNHHQELGSENMNLQNYTEFVGNVLESSIFNGKQAIGSEKESLQMQITRIPSTKENLNKRINLVEKIPHQNNHNHPCQQQQISSYQHENTPFSVDINSPTQISDHTYKNSFEMQIKDQPNQRKSNQYKNFPAIESEHFTPHFHRQSQTQPTGINDLHRISRIEESSNSKGDLVESSSFHIQTASGNELQNELSPIISHVRMQSSEMQDQRLSPVAVNSLLNLDVDKEFSTDKLYSHNELMDAVNYRTRQAQEQSSLAQIRQNTFKETSNSEQLHSHNELMDAVNYHTKQAQEKRSHNGDQFGWHPNFISINYDANRSSVINPSHRQQHDWEASSSTATKNQFDQNYSYEGRTFAAGIETVPHLTRHLQENDHSSLNSGQRIFEIPAIGNSVDWPDKHGMQQSTYQELGYTPEHFTGEFNSQATHFGAPALIDEQPNVDNRSTLSPSSPPFTRISDSTYQRAKGPFFGKYDGRL